jgi:N-dimethylarginine dimethylaminohydrolase
MAGSVKLTTSTPTSQVNPQHGVKVLSMEDIAPVIRGVAALAQFLEKKSITVQVLRERRQLPDLLYR